MLLYAIAISVYALGRSDSPSRVEPAGLVLAKLAQELGRRVSVAPTLARNLIFLVRHESKPDEAIADVAKALHASVTQQGETLRITRTQTDKSTFEVTRTAERARWIRHRLETVEIYRSKHRTDSAGDAVVAEIMRQADVADRLARGLAVPEANFATELLPSEALLWNLIKRIGVDKVAAVPTWSTIVWEDQPAGGSEPLPNHDDLVNKCLDEFRKLGQPPLSERVRVQLPRLGMTEFFRGWGEERQSPHKLRLMERAEDGLITFSLTGYDRKGAQILFAAEHASPGEILRFPTSIAAPYLKDPKGVWVSLPLVDMSPTKFKRLLPNNPMPDWMLNADKTEPMNLFVADALTKLADLDRSACFTINVSDGIWQDVAGSVVDKRLNVDALKALFKEWSLYEEVRESGSVVWRSRVNIDGSGDQADRRALATLARTVARTGTINLRSMAAFAATAAPHRTALTNIWMYGILDSPAVHQQAGYAQYSIYRLLGGMRQSAWDVLTEGSTITADRAGVSESLRDVIEEEYEPVRGDEAFSDLYQHANELFETESFGETRISFANRSSKVIGILNNGIRRPRWGDAAHPGGLLSAGLIRLRGLGKLATTREQFESALVASGAKVALGTRTKITVVVSLPHGLFFSEEGGEEIAPMTDFREFAALTEASRAAIWERMVQDMQNGRISATSKESTTKGSLNLPLSNPPPSK